MNPVTVLLGVAAAGFGIYTAWARHAKPEQLGKLEAMRKAWGDRAGSLIHLTAYAILPIVVGAVFVVLGVEGVSLF
ncbi:MAG TPA: hypothetical protein VKU85_10800 [bacterium]|nr:hypothetical protein [bacterium]